MIELNIQKPKEMSKLALHIILLNKSGAIELKPDLLVIQNKLIQFDLSKLDQGQRILLVLEKQANDGGRICADVRKDNQNLIQAECTLTPDSQFHELGFFYQNNTSTHAIDELTPCVYFSDKEFTELDKLKQSKLVVL